MATHKTPSFQEDHDSQIPAIKLLINLGYEYLTQDEVMKARGGKVSNVVLDEVLEAQLKKINKITAKGKEHKFSDNNIRAAIQEIKDQPNQGLVATNEAIYDLITLGKSYEETIDGDTKSYTLQYVDWNPATFLNNNKFHVAEEFVVEKSANTETRRPDIVLFVNGIPFVVIECKRRDLDKALSQAIEQHNRNQQEIPKLFHFAQILMAVSVNDAKYATTGTKDKFWAFWREKSDYMSELGHLINKPLSKETKERIFLDREKWEVDLINEFEAQGKRTETEQDVAIYSLLRRDRLLELTYQFMVFEKPYKKICRYQQYFAVKNTLERVTKFTDDGKRQGGVIWHTQGSGKSLTMVMMAKALSQHPEIPTPKVVIVTDRKDLDEQIKKTFIRTGKETVQAKTGAHLAELLQSPKSFVVTTVINKFEAVINRNDVVLDSRDIFILVDESHRTNYGSFNVNMRRVFTNGCYIGFTGTPLMKKDKNTANQFGGFIDTYTIDQAVEDKAVVPLLYEGRHILQDVDQKPLDQWFERVSRDLTEEQKKDLKRKFATANQLNKAEEKIKQVAYDVSDHFSKNWKGTPFKGQLTAPDKQTAIKIKKYMDEFGLVSSDVVISAPDTREGTEDPLEETSDEVQRFWKKMMEQYGSDDNYNKTIVENFLEKEDPEIIIVVDKLLTGFDAPRNTVLYIARSLKEHTLLQAIARVNRLYDGKDHGFIIDYYGILGDLDQALTQYGPLSGFDLDDIGNTLTNVTEEASKLPQKHSVLWDTFKTIKNKMDIEEYERFLGDEAVRVEFYKKLSDYSRCFGVAISSVEFVEKTSKADQDRYRKDLAFFQRLRASVKSRYAETIDYKEYEPKIQRLIDTYVGAAEPIRLNEPVNIFDKDAFGKEISKLGSDASKADTIAHRTKKTISERMDDDPVFYKRFSQLLEEAIKAWKDERISAAEYLKKASEIMDSVLNRKEDLPQALVNKDVAKAFYGIAGKVLNQVLGEGTKATDLSVKIALAVDDLIQSHLRRDWVTDRDAANKMKNDIDDFLFDLRSSENVNLSTQQIDMIIEECINVAKRRYAR